MIHIIGLNILYFQSVDTVEYSTVHYSTVHYSIVQCSAVQSVIGDPPSHGVELLCFRCYYYNIRTYN